MTTKIIFLDFDGPLSNSRTNLAKGEFQPESFDPTTVQCLNEICAASGAKIVCTSTRASLGLRHIFHETMRLFENSGLDIRHIHHDWSCTYDTGERENHIKKWLAEHPEVINFAIVDDETVDLENFVRISKNDGIMYADFERIAQCLGTELWEIQRCSLKTNSQGGQLHLAFSLRDRRINEKILKEDHTP